MAIYNDEAKWDEEIHILSRDTPILGGQPEWDNIRMLDGYSNVPIAQLANRTRFLRDRVNEIGENSGGDSGEGIEDAPQNGVFLRQEEKWLELEAGENIELDNSDPDKIVVNYTGTKIVALTQSEYDQITPDPEILYIILEDE